MARIRPLTPILFSAALQSGNPDISNLLAPPFDVFTQELRERLLAREARNIVAIDLPWMPPKAVGPDEVYRAAGHHFAQWLAQGTLTRLRQPTLLVYRQTYQVKGTTHQRLGLFAAVQVQPFGRSPDGRGGVWPHELTFRSGIEDRIRLMRQTRTQMSPVFSMYSDERGSITDILHQVMAHHPPAYHGTTLHDGVLHEVWRVEDAPTLAALTQALEGSDIYIADGHHRYTTAWTYRDELAAQQGGPLPEDHPANWVMMVLVARQDPGMLVLPTHRVLGGMTHFDMARFVDFAQGKLRIEPFPGTDLAALEAALPSAGPHALGLYNPAQPQAPLAVATTLEEDPLRVTHPEQSAAWRTLDVAIVQHLLVEGICQPHFCTGEAKVTWKYPSSLEDFARDCQGPGAQLGVMVQPTPLQAVMDVSDAGGLMPQKSTFFYPKLATGLVINPIA